MAKYETMLVTSAALDEEATTALVGKFKEGVYTVITFTSEPNFPAELDRVYKITDGVLRTMIVAQAE